MTLRMLLREALAAARSTPVPSALVALVVAAMCFAAVTTVGRQAALETALAEELAGLAARTLTVTDSSGSGTLTGPVLTTLTALRGTQAVVARDAPVDAVNGALGPGSTRVAVVGLHGTVNAAIDITRGRMPARGEVIVPEPMLQTLRLAEPAGYLLASDGTQWAIVGAFQPREPFTDFATWAITRPPTRPNTTLQQVRVVAGSRDQVLAVQQASLAIIDADPTQVQVSAATALGATTQSVTGHVAGLGRATLLLILGVGAFFVAVVVLADVLIRRRDLGRRRTLGITRGDLVSLVLLRTTTPALTGAVIGAATGYALVNQHTTGTAPLDFTIGVAVLATLTATLASIPPAGFAATRDPVEVMRTP